MIGQRTSALSVVMNYVKLNRKTTCACSRCHRFRSCCRPRRSRWSPRGLVVASLVTAVSLVLYATLQPAASTRSVQPLAVQFGTASAGSVAAPERRGAAGLFQCWPDAARSSGDSAVAWTDNQRRRRVRRRAGGSATPRLCRSAGHGRDASQFVQVAGKGHVVQVAEKPSALRLNDMQLDCVRTSDD